MPSSGQITSERVERVGIALSGGGVRASLFAFGALLYLAQAAENRRVKVIVSVSGGSIASAGMYSAGDFAQASFADVVAAGSLLSGRLAGRGAFFVPSLKRTVMWFAAAGLAGLVLMMGFIASTASEVEPAAGQDRGGEDGFFGLLDLVVVLVVTSLSFAFLLLVLATIYVLAARRRIQTKVYRTVLADLDGAFSDHSEPSAGGSTGDGSGMREVEHVFCATELTSGQPLFMTDNWTYSPVYGWGNPLDDLSGIVYSSAAFPGVFPPQQIKTQPMEFAGGSTNLDRPTRLVVADGGIYNNLGTDWFDTLDRLDDVMWGRDGRYRRTAPVDHVVVVNASAPAEEIRFPRWWPIRRVAALLRMNTVLYENTVRPRLEAMIENSSAGGLSIVDISKSPPSTARWLATQTRQVDQTEVPQRAMAVAKALERMPAGFWPKFVERTSFLDTTLGAIGVEQAARLVRHGYLNTLVTFHTKFKSAGLELAPDENWFLTLAKGRNPLAPVPHQPATDTSQPTPKPHHQRRPAKTRATGHRGEDGPGQPRDPYDGASDRAADT